MRVALPGKVEHGVGGMQVRMPSPAIRQAAQGHLAEDGGQGPVVTALYAAARHAGDVHHLLEASFPFAAQVQVVLVELAEQFSAPVRQLVFELAVTERAGLPPAQERQHLFEAVPARAESDLLGGPAVHGWSPPPRSPTALAL